MRNTITPSLKFLSRGLIVFGLLFVLHQTTFAQIVDGGPCAQNKSSNACAICGPGPIDSNDVAMCATCAGNDTAPGCSKCAQNTSDPICNAEQEDTNPTPNSGDKQIEKCSITSFSGAGQCIIDLALGIFDLAVLPLFTGLLRLSSYFFEVTIWLGIVQFSALLGGDSPWINSIWSTIRDILNIGVIFVLLYAAIKVTVGQGGEIKKLIAGVILFGVMTNFSLFLTKAAIDIANVVALEFYNQMRVESDIHELSFNSGLGATIAQTTGLVKLYSLPDEQSKQDDGSSPLDGLTSNQALKNSFLFRFSMLAVFIAVSFIFLQAGFIFLGRTIALIFIMIFSPLMFAGGVFAPLEKWISRWHKEFVGQVMLAPIFFILLYVAMAILGSLVTALDGLLETYDNNGEDFVLPLISILISSALVIFAFATALNKAKEMSGSIGGKAAGAGSWVGGKLLGGGTNLALGGAAAAMRRVVKATGVGDYVTKNPNSFASRMGLAKLANSTLDIRNTKTGAMAGRGVSAALRATSGGVVDISGTKIVGSKTTVLEQKGPMATIKDGIKTYNEKTEKAFNERAGVALKAKLKKIEEETELKTDNSVLDREVKYRDEAGKLQTKVRTGAETEEEWKGFIDKTNKANKKYISGAKNKYLGEGKSSFAASTRGVILGRAARAEYRARQTELKKTTDSPQYKLEQYKEKLSKNYTNEIGLSIEDIGKLKTDDLIVNWDIVKRNLESKLKNLGPAPSGAEDLKKWKEEKRILDINLGEAKGALKNIPELEKKIKGEADAAKKKVDEPKDKK